MKHIALFCMLIVASSFVFAQSITKASQDSIIARYLKRGAWKYDYFDKEWEQCINKGLTEDSTVAYLWQQKAMPYFKQHKYEAGIQFLDKAVAYDKKWLDYRAFIKCIFGRNYRDALVDFEQCNQLHPGGYIMDHPYDFYIALCDLQLNEYTKACEILTGLVDKTAQSKGNEWVHPSELFYLGIANYELQQYDKALEIFDKAIAINAHFSDAKYYKGKCLKLLHQEEASKLLFKEADEDFAKGYTLSEDNIVYEYYPYQVYWKWKRDTKNF